jgi:hypothetical protein
VHPRTHIDAVTGVIAHPLGRDAGERVVQELDSNTRPIAALRNVEFWSRQQQEMVRAGPGKAPGARDVAGELWSY